MNEPNTDKLCRGIRSLDFSCSQFNIKPRLFYAALHAWPL
jgi:hypothetical protein